MNKSKNNFKNGLYLSVNVFNTKVLIGDTIFRSPTGGRSSEPREGLAASRAEPVLSILRFF